MRARELGEIDDDLAVVYRMSMFNPKERIRLVREGVKCVISLLTTDQQAHIH